MTLDTETLLETSQSSTGRKMKAPKADNQDWKTERESWSCSGCLERLGENGMLGHECKPKAELRETSLEKAAAAASHELKGDDVYASSLYQGAFEAGAK